MKRDMSGTIGKNDRRTKETHPTHSGSAMVDGKDYWISGWVKSSARGQFLSLAFKLKEQQEEPIPAPEFNDDIPF